MPTAILIPLFAICCCVLVVQGALQCFAPARLKRIEDKLGLFRVNKDSAGGAFIRKARIKQARNPSLLYRLSGLLLMGIGLWMLISALKFIR
ncbi:MAG TPA: hypothetical protein VGF82_07665 [Terracidiphilus sp.]|jgi:uncharacterized protein YjeT (DUF2065 family)